jgi:hypothetical protein
MNKKSITKSVKYYSNFMSLYEFLVDSQFSSPEQDDDFTGQIEIEPELLNKLVEKFNALYISRRKGYLLQDHFLVNEKGIAFTFKNKTLTDFVMQDHLRGKHTIACYPCNAYTTKWFLFDVDVALNDQDAVAFAKRYTKKLIKTLRAYIPEEYIHCYRSGSKGYHVVIYLRAPFLRQRIEDFQNHIIAMAGLQQLDNGKIEIMPQISDNTTLGKTAKLPLGRNYINQEYGSNYCCPVNLNTLEYKPSPYRYFLDIEQLDKSFFENVVGLVAAIMKEKHFPKRNVEKKEGGTTSPIIIQQTNVFSFCNNHEITAYGQRHNMTFDLAVQLKTLYGSSQKETEAALLDWLDNQEGRYSTGKVAAIKDTKFQVQYVYSKGYERRGKLVESVILSAHDTAFFADIVNDKDKVGVMERNAMTVLVALIRHAKLFLSNQFFMSYDKIIELTDIRRTAINPCLRRLESLGKIEIIERVEFTKGIPQANTYKIALDVNQQDESEGYTIHYDSKINVLAILKRFYSDQQLKTILTKSLITALKNDRSAF